MQKFGAGRPCERIDRIPVQYCQQHCHWAALRYPCYRVTSSEHDERPFRTIAQVKVSIAVVESKQSLGATMLPNCLRYY